MVLAGLRDERRGRRWTVAAERARRRACARGRHRRGCGRLPGLRAGRLGSSRALRFLVHNPTADNPTADAGLLQTTVRSPGAGCTSPRHTPSFCSACPRSSPSPPCSTASSRRSSTRSSQSSTLSVRPCLSSRTPPFLTPPPSQASPRTFSNLSSILRFPPMILNKTPPLLIQQIPASSMSSLLMTRTVLSLDCVYTWIPGTTSGLQTPLRLPLLR